MNQSPEHFHFVTGRLAEPAVRNIVQQTAEQFNFRYSIDVLPITVAALMTPKWLLRHMAIPSAATHVVLPGHLENELEWIREKLDRRVTCGPKDIRDLPMFFGGKRERDANYGSHSIELIAEINHAARLSLDELHTTAQGLLKAGADVIDLGCTPGYYWSAVGDAVQSLRAAGMRVSIDSFDTREVSIACRAGAELVLSVNSSNREAAVDWGARVVVIPDNTGDEKSFSESIDFLLQRDILIRLDPILEPLGCGFTNSLLRYAKCRHEYPDAQMMMGIGNITELTDADSAAINTLLLGICQELRIDSVLTTQVINWARSSVRECDLARRLMHYAVAQRIPPKHLEPALVVLRDTRVHEYPTEVLNELSEKIRDKNIRLYNSGGEIHALSANVHVASEDPFIAMERLLASPVGESINAEHAFYLGFEMAKAMTANTLGKNYVQDEPLDWGFLTRREPHNRLRRPSKPTKPKQP